MTDRSPTNGARPRPGGDDWCYLAQRLGIDLERPPVTGPCRGPLAGPSDEAPLDKMLRLSTQMEQLADEIESLASATYRAQLWRQWHHQESRPGLRAENTRGRRASGPS